MEIEKYINEEMERRGLVNCTECDGKGYMKHFWVLCPACRGRGVVSIGGRKWKK